MSADTIVDRVAEAIAEASGFTDDGAVRGFRAIARAAIKAMREPTPAMAAKGFIADDCTAPMDVWRAMIDEALR